MSKGYSKNSWGSSQSPLIVPNPSLIGGNGGPVPKKGGFDLLKDYLSFELRDNQLEGMADHFNAWLADESYLEEYSHLKPTRQDKIIVRLYRYEAKVSDIFIDPNTGGPLTGYKILPYCKVVAAHEEGKFKKGTILVCPEDITKLKTNPAWIEWSVGKQNGDFEDVPEPERMGGTLARWKEHIIRRNFLTMDEDDHFTFSLSDMEFKVRIG